MNLEQSRLESAIHIGKDHKYIQPEDDGEVMRPRIAVGEPTQENVPECSKEGSKQTTSLAQKCRKIKAQKLLQKFIKKHIQTVAGGFDIKQFDNPDIIKHRQQVNLSDQNQIHQDLELIRTEYQKLFQNQTQFAKKIAHEFKQNMQIFNALAIALTQCGKTGTMLALIFEMISQCKVPLKNVFIITGYSSKLWIQQTKDRMPNCIHKNIFHRNTLHKFVQAAQNKQNILVITDETHIASLKNQTIHKAFKKLNLFDIDFIYKQNIKFVHFTATPQHILNDIQKWKIGAKTFIMEPPNDYISIFNLLDRGQIVQCKDLAGFNTQGELVNPLYKQNIQQIKIMIQDKFNTPLWHIIRTKNGKLHETTIENFKQVFQTQQFQFISETTVKDMDQLFEQPPDKHTFVFIKEKLRCSKTLKKQYIGILYERAVKKTTIAPVIQGLPGRITGYHNLTHHIIFADIQAIIDYKQLWEFIKQNNFKMIQTSNLKLSLFAL